MSDAALHLWATFFDFWFIVGIAAFVVAVPILVVQLIFGHPLARRPNVPEPPPFPAHQTPTEGD